MPLDLNGKTPAGTGHVLGKKVSYGFQEVVG